MRRGVLFVAFVAIVVLSCSVWAVNIENPSFEYSIPGGDFDRPAGWDTENYVAVWEVFTPVPEQGQAQWQIAELTAYDGNSFVVLSTGDIMPDPYFSRMWQNVTFEAGEIFSGVYFFGTCDYGPYSDYAEITFVAAPNSGLDNIGLVHIDVEDVGDFGSTNGWQVFQHTFTESDAGAYTLEFLVQDNLDFIYKSYLAVDGLIPEPATLLVLGLGAILLRRKIKEYNL